MDDNDELLVYFGGPVKTLGDGRVGGHLVLFGDPEMPDLSPARDYFTPETDFDLDEPEDRRSVYYHHGADPVIGQRKLGKARLGRDDVGVWIEAQLELRDEYEQAIYELAAAGKLGWSSGTVAHLMGREKAGNASRVTRWPIAEASLTPTPADWRNVATPLKALQVAPLKMLVTADGSTQPEATEPEAPATGAAMVAAEEPEAVKITASDRSTEVRNVTDEMVERDDSVKALESKVDTLSETLSKITEFIENSPALRSAGYYSVDGGTADQGIKSLGDWFLAVKRHDAKRLNAVYGSVKDLTGDTGSGGGYLVPEEFHAELFQLIEATSPIVARVRRIRVATDAGNFPALDISVVPTAGSGETAQAAGVKPTGRKQAGAYTETEPSFSQIAYRAKSLGGYTQIANELVADSAISIDAVLRAIFEMALANRLEANILRGNGSDSQFLGILNAPVAVGVTPDTNNTFAYADMVEMISRFKGVSGQQPVFVIHPSIFNDLASFAIGSAGIPRGAGDQVMFGTMPGTNFPILTSQHAPQADNSGCVILADLGAYLVLERQPFAIAYSEHAGFLNGVGTWRFDYRADGTPWMKSAITLADPQGSYTVSPFVYFND